MKPIISHRTNIIPLFLDPFFYTSLYRTYVVYETVPQHRKIFISILQNHLFFLFALSKKIPRHPLIKKTTSMFRSDATQVLLRD